MGRYTPEEIAQLSDRIGRRIGARQLKNGLWVPDWSLHDELGLDKPDLEQNKDAFIQLITRYRSTQPNKPERISSIWTPYIDAELSRASTEGGDIMDWPYSPGWPDDSPPYFTVLGGTSATGKSTLRRQVWNRWSRSSTDYGSMAEELANDEETPFKIGSVIVDPDNAKMILPEYQTHLLHQIPGGSTYVHDESRNVAEALRKRAAEQNMSIVYDTSGQFNGTQGTLAEMRAKGYYIPAVYFFGNISTLVERAKLRERTTGRSVPPGIIPVMQQNLISIVPQLWNNKDFDQIILVDSTNVDNPEIMLWLKRRPDGGVDTVISATDTELYAQYFGNNTGLFRT